MTSTNELLLPGLDGSNPLAFLAALGTWRITDKCYPGTRMRWTSHGGHWSPMLSFPGQKPEDYVERLHEELRKTERLSVFELNKDLKINAEVFRKTAHAAQEINDVITLSFLSSFGSDAILDRYGNIIGTFFDLMNAGKQYFLQTSRKLIIETTASDIRNTLFEQWSYSNDRGGMRWDPEEDRRWGYRWNDPQSETTASQWGANRLGIEALPLLQSYPSKTRIQTTGFRSLGKKSTYCHWPIWRETIPLSIIQSVLCLSEITTHSPDSQLLNELGILAVFRNQRIWKGKAPNDYSNFTPAVQIG